MLFLGGRNGWGSRQRAPQKGHQPRTIPQSACGCQLPLHKGAFGDGGCGLPRRPCGPPRNDKRFLSFRGAERRGNPSFLRWTMDGDPGRRGRRPLRKRGIAAATTQASDAQRSVCAAVTRSKRESAQRPSKRGSPPRPPRQRLAKRKARKEQLVKFSLCPIISECSTAHNVRKSQQSPARAPVGAASIEQNRLEPHPAARQGA